jgi:fucose 4-O-acetylase-like acetyltransferase
MQREAYFDNAKLLFIFLVVFGHLIQPLKQEIEVIDALYQTIYLMHMPAFVLISGFFAKGSSEKGYLIKLAKRILFPYLLFHIFYTLYYYGIGKNNWDTTLYDPHWGLWFLLSLFSWHLLLIVFKQMKPLPSLVVAILVGIGVGYVPFIGEAFSLSRTFVFFPFFLIGFLLTKERLFLAMEKTKRWIPALLLLTVFVISYIGPKIHAHWLFGSHSFQDLGMPVEGGIVRLLLYSVALLMVWAVFMLIPRKNYHFTRLGQKTMYVYLLHGVIIQYIRQANLLQLDHNLDTIGLAVIAASIVWLLSSDFVSTFTQPIVEGKITEIQKWNRQRHKKYTFKEKSSS